MSEASNKKSKQPSSKLLKVTPAENVAAPKMSLDDLAKELNRDATFKQYNSSKLASDVALPQVIPSGFLAIDHKLGIGGWPRGRIIQLYGSESSYKSTICLRTVAQVQKLGGKAVWIDAEHSFDPNWSTMNGVNNKALRVFDDIDVLEDALKVVDTAAKGGIDLIILDSLAACPALLEKYLDENRKQVRPLTKEARMALTAQIWTKWGRTGPTYIARNGITFIIINQLRSSMQMYGSPTSVPGGKAVKHMCSVMLNLRRLTDKESIINDKTTGDPIGQKYKFTLDKTRFGAIGTTGEFTIIKTKIDNITPIRDIAMREGIITPGNGSHWKVGSTTVNGKDAVWNYLAGHVEVRKDIEQAIRSKLGFNIPQNFRDEIYLGDTSDVETIEDQDDVQDDETAVEEQE